MGSFRDQPFTHRMNGMGDQAEAVFEKVWPLGWARYGLNRPPINMASIPAKLRYTPDYITSAALVEVQGCGRDGIIKLKHDKREALTRWADEHPTLLFMFDAVGARWATYAIERIGDLITGEGEFNEGKRYHEISVATVPDECWVPIT